MTKTVLFAYGSLKHSFHNHYLLERSKYLGNGYTKSKYALYERGIPFVIKDEQVSVIYGELYEISDKTLKQLDKLECHPDWYCREQVEIITETGKNILAWLYFYPQPNGKLNTTGLY